MTKTLIAKPISIKEANNFVKEHHRHHRPTARNCGRWGLGAYNQREELVGVAIAANPVSPWLMDGLTLELTRVCSVVGAPKGTCSFLLSRCCKIWRLMGGSRVITYTLESESGASLKGAGWIKVAEVKPHDRWLKRSLKDGVKREDLMVYKIKKYRWEKAIP